MKYSFLTELKYDLDIYLKKLTLGQELIVRYKHGLFYDDFGEKTFQWISKNVYLPSLRNGKKLYPPRKVSRERIKQLYEVAIKRLKHFMTTSDWETLHSPLVRDEKYYIPENPVFAYWNVFPMDMLRKKWRF